MKTITSSLKQGAPTVVTITDRNYVLPVYILLLSLKYHGVQCRARVLGVDLTEEQKRLLDQFDGVEIIEGDLSNSRNATTRKAEAILAARDTGAEFITLLDGDCIATGDITKYLTPDRPGLMSRRKTDAEDGGCFRKHYLPGEKRGGVPQKILDSWREDVGDRPESAIRNTVIGGNLCVHRDHLEFIELWHAQMMKVLPNEGTEYAYDYNSQAYFQLDESVLNSLLAFSSKAPPMLDYLFGKDVNAYVAHLGPGRPRFWEGWRFDRLRYHPQIMTMLDWGRDRGYELPKLPWTLRKANKPFVYLSAWKHGAMETAKRALRPAYELGKRVFAGRERPANLQSEDNQKTAPALG